MARITVPEAEALIDQKIEVLNHGFVRLVDYLGGDERIVQAARVSYGAGTKSVREDRGLIHYLMRNQHTSPFEQVQLTFHCKMPIFIARQWVRHRTARLNEISGRYSVMKDEFYVPELDEICLQSSNNKQGSGDALPIEEAQEIIELMAQDQKAAYARYEEYIARGIAREMARVNLPLSLYTEWYWQMDLHNLFHFLQLRTDAHAQRQIRVFGEAIATCVKAVAPIAYEAFEEYVLNAITFSRSESALLALMLQLDTVPNDHKLSDRNLAAFTDKLKKLRQATPLDATVAELQPAST